MKHGREICLRPLAVRENEIKIELNEREEKTTKRREEKREKKPQESK